MFFKSFVKVFNNSYDNLYHDNFSKVDQGLVKFFKTEYGTNWQAVLEHHLYKEKTNKNKKAA